MDDFTKLIMEDRKESQLPKFKGNFLDYLHIISENPDLAKLSHERIYNIISEPGVEIISTEENARLRRIYGNNFIKQYNFFKEEFFGINNTVLI